MLLRAIMNRIKNFSRRIFVLPVVRLLLRLKVQPNVITISSFIFAVIAFFTYRSGNFGVGAIFLFLCGIFDTFDGEIARQTKCTTKFGGFLDSTVDRINEFLIYLGLFSFYYNRENYALYWTVLAMFGSMMVSYTRARAEGVGISPQVGIFERFVRFTLLIIGSFLGSTRMIYILAILAIGTILTALQRIFFVSQSCVKTKIGQ